MKSKRLKINMFVLLILSIFVALSGCQSKSTSKANTKSSEGKVTLKFYDWFDEEKYMTEVLKAFEEKHPNIKVDATYVPTSEYNQKLLVNLSSGENMDVFLSGTPGLLGQYQPKDLLLPLDKYVNEDDIKNVKQTVDQLKMNGKMYAFPYRASAWVLYYNKDIFDKAGIKYPDSTWTWEKYAEVSKQITNKDIKGSLSFDIKRPWYIVPATASGYTMPKKQEDLKEFMKALRFLYDMTYKDGSQQKYSDLVGEAGADYSGRFLQGKTGMMFTGDWGVEMLNRAIKERGMNFNYDIAPMPFWEGNKPATSGSVSIAMVSKKTKFPKEAAELAKFLSSEEASNIIARHGILPAVKTDKVKETFSKSFNKPKNIGAFFERPVYSEVPPDPQYDKAMQIVKEEAGLYLLKEKTYNEMYKELQERLKKEVQ